MIFFNVKNKIGTVNFDIFLIKVVTINQLQR